MRMKVGFLAAMVGQIVLMAPMPAWAHHSFAAYNMAKTVSAAGTIKEFRWGAPHSSVVLVYKDKAGKEGQMSIVSGSPLMFAKKGFAPRDFKRGDKVHITYHPNANGLPGGALASLTFSNGRIFSDDEAAKAAPPGS
ncbi:hypothetical protein WSK_1815 [Novosphingobium sp. Rr 2-17]|uniref:DUF6152 family protein n=1 Tax=Novosphingobium sp. Rr 2-17 TaxID=555793 RepID=UPI000269AB32|nr:DUF6152 family protein [Novosphingobium sp. Rr 2-17]EIZ79582.1 hypothetical protein WSK_1815 [Novosphingobium sp. Rr 2-17]